ncbi:hypothetical protein C457_01575 [Haloferax prahovense DSM 18310]|uniref:Uncharacterized protein n=1 Tax=Haloferax prahovense (strain DSM 18310 / JCM 13924 / TL6) TaxID=1227461 RepID=M0GQZ3_HALPT|nr:MULTISPECIES: hypothetical protein [Haloferax]ELZ73932.1 hypothetical protein C457_01575 [Haloferax prahovense DSM 18310]RDZ42924.1 hypothetical protein C5B86_14650 [Haloferax sp. Atlit-19N]
MLGDLIADLILEVVFRPVLKAMDLFVAGVKKRLARIRARFGGDGGNGGDGVGAATDNGNAGVGREYDAADRERSTERN